VRDNALTVGSLAAFRSFDVIVSIKLVFGVGLRDDVLVRQWQMAKNSSQAAAFPTPGGSCHCYCARPFLPRLQDRLP